MDVDLGNVLVFLCFDLDLLFNRSVTMDLDFLKCFLRTCQSIRPVFLSIFELRSDDLSKNADTFPYFLTVEYFRVVRDNF